MPNADQTNEREAEWDETEALGLRLERATAGVAVGEFLLYTEGRREWWRY